MDPMPGTCESVLEEHQLRIRRSVMGMRASAFDENGIANGERAESAFASSPDEQVALQSTSDDARPRSFLVLRRCARAGIEQLLRG